MMILLNEVKLKHVVQHVFAQLSYLFGQIQALSDSIENTYLF